MLDRALVASERLLELHSTEFLCSASNVILCRQFCITFFFVTLWSGMVMLLHCFIGVNLWRAVKIGIWAPQVMQPSAGTINPSSDFR